MNLNEKEQISNLIDRRIESKWEHSKSSPQTLQFMEKINVELSIIKEKLEEFPTRTEMELSNRKLLEEVMCKADEKYAGKLTEKIVYGLCGIMLTAVIYALVKFVL